MTYCGVCGREIKPRDPRTSLRVRAKGLPDGERRQRLVHDDPRWEFSCADLARGWESGGYGLSIREAAALGKLDRGIGPLTPSKRKDTGMGFKDEYDPDKAPKPEGGDFPPFATEDEKKQLADDGTRLDASAIRFGTSRHGEVAHVDVTSVPAKALPRLRDDKGKLLPKGRTLTFSFDGTVVTRDYLITEAAEWLGSHDGETIPIQLVKNGRTYLIELV